MKINHDPFPDTPDSFHDCVETTLMGLETREGVELRTRRISWIALAAALLVLALGTAVAVVQGNVLHTRMASGGDMLMAQVQDVHMTAAKEGFSFTIDELLKEGDVLYLSYTVTVPEDGRIYLFSPCGMRLDGVPLSCASGLDADFFANLYALGGAYGSSVSQVMELGLERPAADAPAILGAQCVFMLAERPLQKLEAEELEALMTEPDAAGDAHQLMRNADVLYYTDTTVEGDPAPVVYLHYYPEIRTIFEKKGETTLTARELGKTGIAREQCILELSLPLPEQETEATLRNDVVQHIYFMDGYTIEIRRLHLTHFKAEFEALIRSDAAFMEWTDTLPFGQFHELCNADGTDFGRVDYLLSNGGVVLQENGKPVYQVGGSMGGVFSLDGLNEICLAPVESGKRDMQRAVRLTPIRSPEIDGVEATLQQEEDPAAADRLSS